MTIQTIHPLLRAQYTIIDTVSFVFGAVCQQGTHLLIPTISGRFVMITTFLSTLALFTSYSASIVALIQSPTQSIQSLDDLLNSPLMIAIHNEICTEINFSNESDTILQQIYERKLIAPDVCMMDEYIGLEKMRTELIGFIVKAPLAYQVISQRFTETEKCRLSELSLLHSPINTITVRKSFKYKELIKQRFKFYVS